MVKVINLVREIKVICKQDTGNDPVGNEQDVRMKPFNLYYHTL
jgi:hypothetical protein